jgi:hypothetical protein
MAHSLLENKTELHDICEFITSQTGVTNISLDEFVANQAGESASNYEAICIILEAFDISHNQLYRPLEFWVAVRATNKLRCRTLSRTILYKLLNKFGAIGSGGWNFSQFQCLLTPQPVTGNDDSFFEYQTKFRTIVKDSQLGL